MGEQERSSKEQDRHTQESVQHTDQNGFIKNPKGKLYLPESYLSKRSKLLTWLLLKPSIREKTAWDWLKLIFAPALIALIAGGFTLYGVFFQHYFSLERDEAEQNRNQQALLIEYLNEISELVEKGLLTLKDDDNSRTQRTIARARTLSVLRALDSEGKGELIQFLSAAKLIEKDQPIISLNQANLRKAYLGRANLGSANLESAYLGRANLGRAYLGSANLESAYLRKANLRSANLESANLESANLEGANLRSANLEGATGLNPVEVKTACRWETALFSEEFKQKLDQEPDQQVDCSRWK